jgi:membrane protein DedA with SNARE-associated domain
MTRRRALRIAVSGLVLAMAVSIGVLVWYYQPKIEYAYVDILDFRENLDSSRFIIDIVAALALGGLVIWWWVRRRRGDNNGE